MYSVGKTRLATWFLVVVLVVSGFIGARSVVSAVVAAGSDYYVDGANDSDQVVYTNDFNDDPLGTYTIDTLNTDWNNPPWENGVSNGLVEIVEGSEALESKSPKVRYPAGWYSNGTQWQLIFDQSYDELYLSYWVKFEDNFDFVMAGKLPGFCGGTCNSGGNVPDGTDGWSARMMWLGNGEMIQYVYHAGQPSQWGHGFRWDYGGYQRFFVPGQWHHLEHRIVMNTPGQQDGLIQGWFDGELALDKRNPRFRDVDTFGIDMLYFSTFFGGGDPSWAPSKDEYAYFDNFVVSTSRVGHTPTPSPTPDPNKPVLRLEAEEGTLTAPMTVVSDSSTSACEYIHTTSGTGGKVTFNLDIPTAGDYVIWGHAYGLGNSADSFCVSMDGGTTATWDISQGGWVWDRVSNRGGMDPVIYPLTAGQHTLTISQRETGARLDVIEVTSDMNHRPGPLTPCGPTATPLPTATPTFIPTATPTPNPNELIIDDTDPGFSTSYAQDAWQAYVETNGEHYGDSHYYNTQIGGGEDTATWSFDVPQAGRYNVYAWWWEGSWRPTDVPYTVNHLNGSTTVRVNQQADGGQWNLLGTFDFQDQGSVTVFDDASSGDDVVADAVRVVHVGSLPTATPTPTHTPTNTSIPTNTPTPTATLTPNPSELIIDNSDSGFSTNFSQDAWHEYTEVGGQHYGDTHYFNSQIGTGQDVATWSFTVPQPGRYDVYAWWWEGSWRPTDVPYTVNHLGGSTTVRVDQQASGGQWNLLGTFDFQDQGSVEVSDDVSSGQDAVADAVRLVYLGPLRPATPTCILFIPIIFH